MAEKEILNRGFVQYTGPFEAGSSIKPEVEGTYFTSIEIISDSENIVNNYSLQANSTDEIAVTGLVLSNPYLSVLKIEWDDLGEEFLYNIYINGFLYAENIEHQTLMFEYLMDCGPYNVKIQAVLDGKEVGIAAEDSIIITIYSANAMVSTLELTDEDYATIDTDAIENWAQLEGISKNGTTAWVDENILNTFGNAGLRGFYNAGPLDVKWNISEEFEALDVFAFVTTGNLATGVIINEITYENDNVNIWIGNDCVYINQDLLLVEKDTEKIFIITAVDSSVGDNGTFALKIVGEKTPEPVGPPNLDINIPNAESGAWMQETNPIEGYTTLNSWWIPNANLVNYFQLAPTSASLTYEAKNIITEPVIALGLLNLDLGNSPLQSLWINETQIELDVDGYISSNVIVFKQSLFNIENDNFDNLYYLTARDINNIDHIIPIVISTIEEVTGLVVTPSKGSADIIWSKTENTPLDQVYYVYSRETGTETFHQYNSIGIPVSNSGVYFATTPGIYDIKVTSELGYVETNGAIQTNVEITAGYPAVQKFNVTLNEDPSILNFNWELNLVDYNAYNIDIINKNNGEILYTIKNFEMVLDEYNNYIYPSIFIEDHPEWAGLELQFNIYGSKIYISNGVINTQYIGAGQSTIQTIKIPTEINYSWFPSGESFTDTFENTKEHFQYELRVAWGITNINKIDTTKVYYAYSTDGVEFSEYSLYKEVDKSITNISMFPLEPGYYKIKLSATQGNLESKLIDVAEWGVEPNNYIAQVVSDDENHSVEEIMEIYSAFIESVSYAKFLDEQNNFKVQYTFENLKENTLPLRYNVNILEDGKLIYNYPLVGYGRIEGSNFLTFDVSLEEGGEPLHYSGDNIQMEVTPIYIINEAERNFDTQIFTVQIQEDNFGTINITGIDLTLENYIGITYQYNILQQLLSDYLQLNLNLSIKVNDNTVFTFLIDNLTALGQQIQNTNTYQAEIIAGKIMLDQSVTFDDSVMLIKEFYVDNNLIESENFQLNIDLPTFTNEIEGSFDSQDNSITAKYNINNEKNDIIKRLYEIKVKEDNQERFAIIKDSSFFVTFPNIIYNYPFYTIQVNITQLGYTGKVEKEVNGYSPNSANWLDIFANTPIYNNSPNKEVYIIEENEQTIIQYHYGEDPTDTTFYVRTKDFQNIILFRFDLLKISQLKYKYKYRLDFALDILTEELNNSTLSLNGYYLSSQTKNISEINLLDIKTNTSIKNQKLSLEFEYDLLPLTNDNNYAYIILELKGNILEDNYATFALSNGFTITDITPYEIKNNKQIEFVNEGDKTQQLFIINADRNKLMFNNVAISNIIFIDGQDNCLVNCVVSDIVKDEGEKGE